MFVYEQFGSTDLPQYEPKFDASPHGRQDLTLDTAGGQFDAGGADLWPTAATVISWRGVVVADDRAGLQTDVRALAALNGTRDKLYRRWHADDALEWCYARAMVKINRNGRTDAPNVQAVDFQFVLLSPHWNSVAQKNDPVLAWDLRDEFTTALTAGNVDGTDAEPGPGTRDIVDTSSNITLSGGAMTFAGGGTGNYAQTLAGYEETITRSAGTMLLIHLNATTVSLLRLGVADAFDGMSGTGRNGFFVVSTSDLRAYFDNSNVSVSNFAASTDHVLAIVLRASGVMLFKQSASGKLRLLWHSSAGTNSPMYVNIGNNAAVLTSDYVRIPTARWLPAPLASDGFATTFGLTDGAGHAETSGEGSGGDGLLWQAQEGYWTVLNAKAMAAALNATNSRAIAVLELDSDDLLIDVDVVRTAGVAGITARYTNASNFLYAYHDGTNAVLKQVLAGSESTLVTGAATYSAGATLRLILDGQEGYLYYNDALVGTTGSIDATLTSANAGLYTTSLTATLDNFVAYARGTGDEYAVLDAYADLVDDGVMPSSPATLLATNDGNATVCDAIIEVTAGSADITALTIACGDAELQYDGTIAAGEILEIDCGALTVKNDGTGDYDNFSLTSNHTVDDWFPLEPGENVITVTFTGGSTDSRVTVRFYDAWH